MDAVVWNAYQYKKSPSPFRFFSLHQKEWVPFTRVLILTVIILPFSFHYFFQSILPFSHISSHYWVNLLSRSVIRCHRDKRSPDHHYSYQTLSQSSSAGQESSQAQMSAHLPRLWGQPHSIVYLFMRYSFNISLSCACTCSIFQLYYIHTRLVPPTHPLSKYYHELCGKLGKLLWIYCQEVYVWLVISWEYTV